MILTCERCETRFRLDESRLPARGARVRCSRCKHAFFVRPPGASQAEAIQEIAEQAAATGRSAPPEQSWDLDEAEARPSPSAAPSAPRNSAQPEPPSEFEDESDWRFEDEVAQLGDAGASLDLPRGEAPTPRADADRNESSFADLGDPESWDLGSSSSGDLPPPRTPIASRAPAPRSEPERAPASAPTAEAPPIERPAAVSVEQAPPPVAVLPRVELSPGARAGGWSVALALAALVALLALLPRSGPDASRLGSVSAGSLEVGGLHARWVDNALAGPIWVVSGELRNPSGDRSPVGVAVDIALLDGFGQPIEGAVATAQPSLTPARLREEDPDLLRGDAAGGAADLAARVLAPNERVAFDAVFASAPPGAARFAVETRQPPARPRPVVEPAAADPAPAAPAVEPAPEG